MKPLNFILAASLAVSTVGSAVAQSTNQAADPFAVSQSTVDLGLFAGLGPAGTTAVLVGVSLGIATIAFVNADGDTVSTTTTAVP